MKGVIVICRHGHATSPDSLDQLPVLSEKGKRDVGRLASRLASEFPAVIPLICSSPTLRALQTAEILHAALGGEIITRDALGEGGNGGGLPRFSEYMETWGRRKPLVIAVTHLFHLSGVSKVLGEKMTPPVDIQFLEWGGHVFDFSKSRYLRIDTEES